MFQSRRMFCLASTAALAVAARASAQDGRYRAINLDVSRTAGPVDRFFDLSVGSDFPGVLARTDSLAHLKTVTDELGFRYLRFHGIFHDVLGTVHKSDGDLVFDWTGIDKLYDALLARRIKPFVELSFSPEALKTSASEVFYWKGNISHPDPKGWDTLVDAFVRHLRDRYGEAEIRTWYFEVWNEPNLGMFWENADQAAYFDLYGRTARIIKGIDPELRVGGPATAGARWIPELIAYCVGTGAPIDFVAFHAYNVVGGFVDLDGKADLKLAPDDWVSGDIHKAQGEIAASARPDLPMYVTEWSTSYSPRDPVHDSYVSAPFILDRLRKMRGVTAGMSYWTFSDLFEENGPPPASYHGGFGLLNREGLRKASFFAYKYLHSLQGETLIVDDTQTMAARSDEAVHVLFWDWQQPQTDMSNRDFYRNLLPATPSVPARITVSRLKAGRYAVTVRRTGYRANDAYSAYIDLGLPTDLTETQVSDLAALTKDSPESARIVTVGADGLFQAEVAMRSNDIVLLELRRET